VTSTGFAPSAVVGIVSELENGDPCSFLRRIEELASFLILVSAKRLFGSRLSMRVVNSLLPITDVFTDTDAPDAHSRVC